MRKKIVFDFDVWGEAESTSEELECVWGETLSALNNSDHTGFIERHCDVDLCFKSIYAWLSYVDAGSDGVYTRTTLSMNGCYSWMKLALSVLAEDPGEHASFFKGRRAYPISANYATCRGHQEGYVCAFCGWNGPTLGTVPKVCKDAWGRESAQHVIHYKVSFLDGFGEPIGEQRIMKAREIIRRSQRESRQKAYARYVLGDDATPEQLALYLPNVGCSNQPCNRGLVERERMGYHGEFLRKYPTVEAWNYGYNARCVRTLQLAKAVAGRVVEDGEPEFRAERRNLHGYLMMKEPRAALKRSWKASKKRKQWMK